MDGSILAGPCALELEDGRQLRLLSAWEVLQARREAGTLAREDREQALCSNACLLARALEENGTPVFHDGREALEGLCVEEIDTLARRWWAFSRRVNPGADAGEETVDALKNVWSTRRRSGCTGACCGHSQPCPPKSACGR